MRMVLDFRATYCPSCGAKIVMGKYAAADFLHRCSFSCDCGVYYQFADSKHVKEAAVKSGGDADRYWE